MSGFEDKNGASRVEGGNIVGIKDADTVNVTFNQFDSGYTFVVGADGLVYTLFANAKIGTTLIIKNNGADGAFGWTLTPESGGSIFGTVGAVTLSGTADASVAHTKATTVKGDYLKVVKHSDGWYAEGTGVYANV